MHLSISCPTTPPERPHTPSGDLTLLLVPTLGAIAQFTDRFLVVAFLNNKIAFAIILLATGVLVSRARRFVWGWQINRLVTVAHFP